MTDNNENPPTSSTDSFQVTVNPGPATQIAIGSASFTIPAAGVGQVTLDLEDSFGNTGAVSSSDQTIDLQSSDATGQFFASQSSTTPITSIGIPAGQSSINVYYSDTTAGMPTLTFTPTSLGAAVTQQETIEPAEAAQIAITSSPLTLTAGGTPGAITIELESANGQPGTSLSPQTITLGTTDTMTGNFYASATSTTPIPNGSIVIQPGDSSATVYYSDTAAGQPTLTFDDTALSSEVSQSATIKAGQATQVVITTAALDVTVGNEGAITVELEDSFGNVITANSSLTLSLSSSSTTGLFYLAPGDTFSVFSVTMNPGESSVTFYYSDTKAETPTVSISDPAVSTSPTTQQESFNAGPASQLAFQSPAIVLTAGNSSSSVTVQLEDSFGNIVPAPSDETVNLASTSSGGSFYASLSALDDDMPTDSVTIPAGDNSVTFYYADSEAGTPTITVSATGLSSATQTEQIDAQPASQLAITSSPLDIAAGSFGAVTFQLEDSSGNPDISNTAQTITLGTTGLSGEFSSSPIVLTPITSFSFGPGASSDTIWYFQTIAGTPTVSVSDTTLDSTSTQQETINPAPASKIVFTNTPLNVKTGIQGELTLAFVDQYGNAGALPALSQTVSFSSSPNGLFFTSPSSSGVKNLTITINAGQASRERLLLPVGRWRGRCDGQRPLVEFEAHTDRNGGLPHGDLGGFRQCPGAAHLYRGERGGHHRRA